MSTQPADGAMMDAPHRVRAQHDEIRSANSAFYRACEVRSLEEMSRIWSHLDDVKCIHPGWRLLRGWPAIRASWKRRFEEVEFQKFGIDDQFIDLHGELAVVTQTEVLLAQADGLTIEKQVQATTLFRKEENGWKVVLYHGSNRQN